MSPDQPPDGAAPIPQQAVVEFGPDQDGSSRAQRRRWSVAGVVSALAADRRSVPLAAAVGGVAVFASLISEWQITGLDITQLGGSDSSRRPLPSGIGDLGAFGAGYLAGLFVLAGAVVLVLFGPPAVRAYGRLIGLSTGGVLLGLLAAIYADLGDVSRSVERIYTLELEPDDLQLTYGRGIWCAVFGVAALTLALYLAGRHVPPTPAVAEPVAEEEAPVVWSWRRPARPDEVEQPPDEPFDLSVSPTKPFTSLNDDRDGAATRDKPG